ATPLDTLLQVLGQEPVAPRRLQPQLPRDLETVCLRCLEKPPGKRYASAAALAEDLRRFLEGRPVKARPVGSLGRLARWGRRNPVVAGLSAAALFLLVAGTAVASYFAVRANANAEVAGQHLREARRESTHLALSQGLTLFEQGEGGRGLLWLARALEL